MADLRLTKLIADCLERHYPAHPWMVQVSHAQGVAMLALPILMKRNQKFVMHIGDLKSDPGLRTVVRAAGEILERLEMPRHGFALDHFLSARERSPIGRKARRLILPNAPPAQQRPKLIGF